MGDLKIRVNGLQIRLDLEEEFQVALKEIAKLEDITVNELYELVYRTSKNQNDFARAIRAFICTYYRNIALILPEDYASALRSRMNKSAPAHGRKER